LSLSTVSDESLHASNQAVWPPGNSFLFPNRLFSSAARAKLSFPGRNPASVNSFTRLAVVFFVAGFCVVWALANVLARTKRKAPASESGRYNGESKH